MAQPTTKAVLLSADALPKEYKSKIGQGPQVAPQPKPAKRRIDETKCFLLKKTNIIVE